MAGTPEQIRQILVSRWETKAELDALDKDIKSGGEAEMVYRGFSKFLQLDLPWNSMPPPGSNAAPPTPTTPSTPATPATPASAAATPTAAGSGGADSKSSANGGWTTNAIKKECGKIARKMMVRNKAFSSLVSQVYPDALRLSIHGHTNAGPKYGILLLEVRRASLSVSVSVVVGLLILYCTVCVGFTGLCDAVA